MQITQEEKVHVAVTKKEEPPRARGTCDLSIHRLLYLPSSLYQMHSLWVFVVVVVVVIVVFFFNVSNNENVKSFMFGLLLENCLCGLSEG